MSDDRHMDQDGERDGDTGRDTGRVLLRVRNGDVIRADETGLTLKLSDTVVADLRERLMASTDASTDVEVLGDLDAWNLRRQGAWWMFEANLPGMSGARGYRRMVSGGGILAETPGPVLGVLSLGGARRSRAIAGRGAYPYHVVSAEDDIGAVGMAGIEKAPRTERAEGLREQTQDALLAAELLNLRQQAGRGLPLMMARCETDRAASLGELGDGPAFENLMRAADNLKALAASLGKPAKLAAVTIDFMIEDVRTPEAEFGAAMRGLLERLAKGFAAKGLRPVPAFMMFDSAAENRRQAQWELAVYNSSGPIYTLPSYSVETDDTLRLTETGMRQRARTEAAVLFEIENGRGWHCPVFLLAEWAGERVIRLRSNAVSPLMIETTDPFGAGADHGVLVEGPEGAVPIASVRIDPEEPRDVVIELAQEAPRRGLRVMYGWDRPGAICDGWAHPFGTDVKRWALPAALEVHG